MDKIRIDEISQSANDPVAHLQPIVEFLRGRAPGQNGGEWRREPGAPVFCFSAPIPFEAIKERFELPATIQFDQRTQQIFDEASGAFILGAKTWLDLPLSNA